MHSIHLVRIFPFSCIGLRFIALLDLHQLLMFEFDSWSSGNTAGFCECQCAQHWYYRHQHQDPQPCCHQVSKPTTTVLARVTSALIIFSGAMLCRFGKRVSRAFSFNKTPRKLKRAMSSMTQIMSPFARRESRVFGGASLNTTPRASHMTAMRLASTNDLTVSVTLWLVRTNETLNHCLNWDTLPFQLDENSLCESTYSDLVDQVTTPTMCRRRDTLAVSLPFPVDHVDEFRVYSSLTWLEL